MEVLGAVLFLTLTTAGLITAVPRFFDGNGDNIRSALTEKTRLRDEVPIENLAMRHFHESIMKAESEEGESLPEVADKLGLAELDKALRTTGLWGTLDSPGEFTLFGPTDEAFQNLPDWFKKHIADKRALRDGLLYHILPGKLELKDLSNEQHTTTMEGKMLRINKYKVKGKKVTTAQCAEIDMDRADQAASNGVLHVLNAVMIPPYGDAITSLSACPVFKTFIKAVGIAGLEDELSGEGPYTLFAPTDKAFDKLPEEDLEELFNNPAKLKKLLKYHVVMKTHCSSGLSSGKVKTWEGQDVTIKVSEDGDVVVNKARVISPDASVTNGVVHAIDTVLSLPDE